MVSVFITSNQSVGATNASEDDNTNFAGGIGGVGFKRAKRLGRNPSTGARTSKRYGLSMIFTTNIPPLTNAIGLPLY